MLFAGTRVPARVVVSHFSASVQALLPELRECVYSWLDPAVPVRVLYYDDASARAFLAEHYSPAVVAAFDSLVPGAFKADLFRYCEIFLRGGIWADIKCARTAPYEQLLNRDGALVVDLFSTGVWNGFFAAPPRAAWVGGCLERALRTIWAKSYGASPLDICGPSCLGRSVRAWLGLADTTCDCDFLLSLSQSLIQSDDLSTIRILRLHQEKKGDATSPLVLRHADERGVRGGSSGVIEVRSTPSYRQQRTKSAVSDYCVAYALRRVYA